MKSWSNAVVTLTVHASEHLGPATTWIDGMTDRLLGKHVAQAACGGAAFCGTTCSDICDSQLRRVRLGLYTHTGLCSQITCTAVLQCGC
jgi:hypothetical protein